MLYSSDLDTYQIQDFCAETLKNSTDFETFCVGIVGSALNYETDAIMNDIDSLPDLPYCSVHSGNEKQDLREEEWGHGYEIALVFGIKDTTSEDDKRPPFVIENDIKKYSSSRNIEKIAKEAIKTIKAKMNSTGIKSDYDIQLLSASGIKTATGEASDMNYVLSLNFNYLQSISKEC